LLFLARDSKRKDYFDNIFYSGLDGLKFLSIRKNIINKAFLKLQFCGFYIKKMDLVDLAFYCGFLYQYIYHQPPFGEFAKPR